MNAVASMLLARIRATVAVLVLIALAQCTSGTEPGGDPPHGVPGRVTYRLVSPHGAEGAMLLGLPAAEVVTVPEGEGLTEVVSRTVGDVLYVAVVHRFGVEGLSLELEVGDVDRPPDPTLLEVAGPDDRLRALGGYTLEIVP